MVCRNGHIICLDYHDLPLGSPSFSYSVENYSYKQVRKLFANLEFIAPNLSNRYLATTDEESSSLPPKHHKTLLGFRIINLVS